MLPKNHRGIIIFTACFMLGVVLGGLSLYLLTRHDCFAMVATANRQVDMVIGGDEAVNGYVELGVKCVAFGKDATNDVKITYLYREDITQDTKPVNAIDVNQPGIYYVVYTATNFRYKNVQLVRTVTVLRAED